MKEQTNQGLRKNFAYNVKKLRKNTNLSQREFAEQIFYSEKTVSKWEKGGVIPPVETLYKIAQFFGVSIDALFSCENERYFLGIDGGGTKTKLMLENLSGECVRELTVGASNPADIGMEKAKQVLTDGIKEILHGIRYGSVSVFAGISGGTSMNNKALLEEFFSQFGFYAYAVGNDVDNIVSTGLDGDGVAVIIGTGLGILRKRGDKLEKVGGWGYLIDEGGSGYNFGKDGLNAYFREVDGSGQKTLITKLINEKTGLAPAELLTSVYEKGKKYIASFCLDVFEAYKQGDFVAGQILERNVKIASDYVKSAIKPFNERVKVVVAGSLGNDSIMQEKLVVALKSENCELNFLTEQPVVGAVKRARKIVENI